MCIRDRYYRYARARGLHYGGGTLPAGPGWSHRSVLFRGGVEPQSETVWRQADKYRVPRIAFINKMDRVGADFRRGVEMIRDRLGANPVPLQLPIGKEDDFRGIIDLVCMTAYLYKDEMGVEWEESAVPDEYLEEAEEARQEIFEVLADTDEEVMDAYLEGKGVGREGSQRPAQSYAETCCGSGTLWVGIQEQGCSDVDGCRGGLSTCST